MIDSLFEWMEDFDNSEVSESERIELLMYSIDDYNGEHNTDYSASHKIVARYFAWKRDKYKPDM